MTGGGPGPAEASRHRRARRPLAAAVSAQVEPIRPLPLPRRVRKPPGRRRVPRPEGKPLPAGNLGPGAGRPARCALPGHHLSRIAANPAPVPACLARRTPSASRSPRRGWPTLSPSTGPPAGATSSARRRRRACRWTTASPSPSTRRAGPLGRGRGFCPQPQPPVPCSEEPAPARAWKFAEKAPPPPRRRSAGRAPVHAPVQGAAAGVSGGVVAGEGGGVPGPPADARGGGAGEGGEGQRDREEGGAVPPAVGGGAGRGAGAGDVQARPTSRSAVFPILPPVWRPCALSKGEPVRVRSLAREAGATGSGSRPQAYKPPSAAAPAARLPPGAEPVETKARFCRLRPAPFFPGKEHREKRETLA